MDSENIRMKNFESLCGILKLEKEKIEEMKSHSDIINLVLRSYNTVIETLGWKGESVLPFIFPILMYLEVMKSAKSPENTEASRQFLENLGSRAKLTTFHKICELMYMEKETIVEMENSSDIIDMVFEGFENAFQGLGWKKGDELDPSFSGKLLGAVLECSKGNKNTPACKQLMGNLIDTLASQPKYPNDEDQKVFDKAYKEFTEMRNKNDPFIHFENQRIRKSRFSQMDHEPCLLVKIPNSNEFVAADKAKMVPWFKAEGFNLKDLHDGDKDRLITFDIFDDKPFVGGVEEFKEALSKIMQSGEKGDKKKKEEESKERLDAEAQRWAEKKKERNRRNRENKKKKRMMAKKSVQDNFTNNSEIPRSTLQDTPTSSETPGSVDSIISEMVQKLLSIDD